MGERIFGSLLAMALLGLPPLAALATEDFPGVRKLMSADEFLRSGLDKLSADELRTLDAWLIEYTVGEAPVLKENNETVREADKNYEVVSRIEGEFSGWDGNTVFRLENGQVWRQRLDGRYFYRGGPRPEVRISRNWLGFYRLTLIEADRSIGVSRVR